LAAAKDMAELQWVMAGMHDILVTEPFVFGGQQDPHKPEWALADTLESAGVSKAWSCKADAAMVRPEGKRCDVLVKSIRAAGLCPTLDLGLYLQPWPLG